MKIDEVRKIKEALLADIERSLVAPMPEVGDKMDTPIGEGTIIGFDGPTMYVTVKPTAAWINEGLGVTIEMVPPSDEPDTEDEEEVYDEW